MTNNVRGVVQRTFEKPFPDGKVLHSFTLKGQDGFFGTGYRKAAIEVGKAYEFEYEIDPKGRKNVNLSTVRPWESGETIQAAPAASFRPAYQRMAKADGGKDDYWRNKELRDVQNDKMRELGATRNTALTLVQLMLSNGAVKLPAKEAAREEVIFQLFEHYTDTLLKGKESESSKDEVSEAIALSQAGTESGGETRAFGEDSSWK